MPLIEEPGPRFGRTNDIAAERERRRERFRKAKRRQERIGTILAWIACAMLVVVATAICTILVALAFVAVRHV